MQRGFKLLIVENDMDYLIQLVAFFERQGYIVKAATSATEAIESLDDTIDLVITENDLPDNISGIQLNTQIKNKINDMRVFLLVGSNYQKNELAFMGLDKVFFKPCRLSVLMGAIQERMSELLKN